MLPNVFLQHEIRSENMDARAFRQAEKGHYGRAAALEVRTRLDGCLRMIVRGMYNIDTS